MDENKSKKYLFFKQNSELEILLSAAIIFAALKMNDGIAGLITDAINANIPNDSPFLIGLAVAGLYLSTLLPLSIVIHFALRIYWLALMGLKSAFPQDVEDISRYSDYFQKIVGRSLNLDKQIKMIDKVSSSLFAFTFLSLFAFCFSFVSCVFIIEGLDKSILPEAVGYAFLVCVVLYAFDFFSLGLLKRIKWPFFKYFYAPIYWVFNILTLAFLYRGIYYTLIHSIPRYLIGIILPSYIFLALFLFNLGYTDSGLFPVRPWLSDYGGKVAHVMMYSDDFDQRENFTIQAPYIKSYIVEKNYLEVFVPVTFDLEDSLVAACDIEPFEERGLNWRNYATFSFNDIEYPEGFNLSENMTRILTCAEDHTVIAIDSVNVEANFLITRRDNPSKTLFKTVLSLDSLKNGSHLLSLQTASTWNRNVVYIPFYLAR